MTDEIVQYEADNGTQIKVTEQDVRDLISASGSQVGNVTSQEIKAYMRLCQAQRLNPFTKDAYLVKYGNSPATIIAGKETFTKRAQRNPRFRGYTAGITVFRDGKVERREGSMLLKGETLLGGWCAVSIDGYDKPMFDEVSFAEYNAPDRNGKNGWSRMPATMIRKVAICHALREAFPEDLGGLYGAEEMDQAKNGGEPPKTPANPEPIVIDADEDVSEQVDPRKDLWNKVGEIKTELLCLGITEEDMKQQLNHLVVDEHGNPIETMYYTEQQIISVIDHLSAQLSVLEAEKAERSSAQEEVIEPDEVDYSDQDIIF